ncbi:hypothetical protein L227DRAFT_555970 [Lentinus tigrinus ALCF2SS1-6]|uniref:Fungal-type protein kinase domain-containing protein n=1 Tax=Lentinus tigrinus ALCF2SS1-6 TaxID=1328759 RepID=A0A5C2RTF8_9APHY|nr:hypothetical protein L227DRAFT_555970 [Lentinus tigrinus ALCF2SS1-6]
MPVKEFLDEFLPPSPTEAFKRSATKAFSAVPSRATTPAEIYEPLIRALNEKTKHKSRTPGMVFRHPPAHLGLSSPFSPPTPHICCYATDNVRDIHHAEASTRVELGYAEFFIEVRPDPIHDMFVDPLSGEEESHQFLSPLDPDLSPLVTRAFAKHMFHVSEIMARQYRTFVFTITMSGSRARLFRWDRSGAIVTKSFDIREEPDILCDFVWRFSCASRLERGHDLTVEPASSSEEDHFRNAVQRHVQKQLDVQGEELDKAVLEHYQLGHVMAIVVFAQDPDMTTISINRFLVSRPVVSPMSPTGRGTRGYWAVRNGSDRVLFLKDTWRYGGDPEGAVLATLNANGVRNVPKLVLHGDVFNKPSTTDEKLPIEKIQSTRTALYVSKPWVCSINGRKPSPSTCIHYRMVVRTVGYGLRRFHGTQELLHATHDVFQAMKDAVRRCYRLHRDVSIGNIILVKEAGNDVRKGYLIDWDASILADEEGRGVEAGRTGTWSFMSSKLLTESDPRHNLQDDMESLVYVILYVALHHLPHNLGSDQLAQFIREFFDASYQWGSRLMGGGAKQANIGNRVMTKRVKFQDAHFQKWLNTVLDLHATMEQADRDEEVADLWSDTSHLDTFWKEFLAENTLASQDRVDNELPQPKFPSTVATFTPPVSRRAVPPPPELAAGVPVGEQPVRSAKRRWLELAALPTEDALAQSNITADGPRRSKRLKVIPSSSLRQR